MTQHIARKVVTRMRGSGLLLADEWVQGKRIPDTETWVVELWAVGSNGGVVRCFTFHLPEDWTEFATMRAERHIGMAYA